MAPGNLEAKMTLISFELQVKGLLKVEAGGEENCMSKGLGITLAVVGVLVVVVFMVFGSYRERQEPDGGQGSECEGRLV